MSDSAGQIMIVDYDAHVRVAVQTVLEDAGFEIVTADSGAQCLELLERGFSGVILLDIMMPDMDGWDTIRAILEHNLEEKIAIVMLTAKNAPDSKMIGLQEYVVDYITKPFENEELIQKVLYFFSFAEETSRIRI
jgi:CheY-like chemotaxis protein